MPTTEIGSATRRELAAAATSLARAGHVGAFGHVSVRLGPPGSRYLAITPPVPLARVDESSGFVALDLEDDDIPAGAPREAWAHIALARARPEVGAICRAQPASVAALAMLDRVPSASTGHAAMIGDIALFPDARLIRTADSAAAVVTAAGSADAVVLRGNGALTLGATLGDAVARMHVLDTAADLELRALAVGTPRPLSPIEQDDWRARASELLPRIYDHLIGNQGRTSR